MDYKRAWKVRLIQIIVINIICGAFVIFVGNEMNEPVAGIVLWFFLSWGFGAAAATFTKNGDRVSEFVYNILEMFFFSVFATLSDGFSIFTAFILVIGMFKAMIGAIIVGAILIYEFFAYPITTIIYFVKSLQE